MFLQMVSLVSLPTTAGQSRKDFDQDKPFRDTENLPTSFRSSQDQARQAAMMNSSHFASSQDLDHCSILGRISRAMPGKTQSCIAKYAVVGHRARRQNGSSSYEMRSEIFARLIWM